MTHLSHSPPAVSKLAWAFTSHGRGQKHPWKCMNAFSGLDFIFANILLAKAGHIPSSENWEGPVCYMGKWEVRRRMKIWSNENNQSITVHDICYGFHLKHLSSWGQTLTDIVEGDFWWTTLLRPGLFIPVLS